MTAQEWGAWIQYYHARDFRFTYLGLSGKKRSFRKCRECNSKLGKFQTRNPVCFECYKKSNKCLNKWLKVYDK